jgi:excinuclease ABC subunit C
MDRRANSDDRKFNIKSVVGINDFASMKESVYRRYASVLDKKLALPQLIIIDGVKDN